LATTADREPSKAAETKKGEAGGFGDTLNAQVVDGHDIVSCAIERWHHRSIIQSLCANLGFVREIPDKPDPTHPKIVFSPRISGRIKEVFAIAQEVIGYRGGV
jgi:hypothetical protein